MFHTNSTLYNVKRQFFAAAEQQEGSDITDADFAFFKIGGKTSYLLYKAVICTDKGEFSELGKFAFHGKKLH